MNIQAPTRLNGIDDGATQRHIEMLNELAVRAWTPGILVLVAFGEDPNTGKSLEPKVRHFDTGDVQGMVATAKKWARIPSLNIYAPWAVFTKDLSRRQKGSERDVEAALAIVVDMDNDTGKGGQLPIEAPYIIETSSGNFQAVYPLSHALTAVAAKPIATALADAVGCDQRTKDVSGVWRIPGLLNWPNRKKVHRGRPSSPQPVRVAKEWTGEFINPEVLEAAVRGRAVAPALSVQHSPQPDRDRSLEELLAAAGEELCGVIEAPPDAAEDRSETAFKVIARLAGKGFTDLEIQRLFEANPEGVGERYAEGKNLAADIRRVREKRAKSRGDPRTAFDDIPPTSKSLAQHSDGPLPLFPPLPPSERYPVEALGPVLSPAAQAIARKVQVPGALAAQSVLSVAALAAQPLADVLMPFGKARPLSLYFITVAGSGDRKSTADSEALEPVLKYEAALKAFHDDDMKSYSVAFAAWSAEKRKIEGKRGIDYAERKRLIADLGPEPAHPLRPSLTVSNLTIEGLLKTWVHAPAALGVFTSEGGQFTQGHGMAEDRRLETAAIYSELWDGTPVKRLRALDGALILHGRRLALHLMIQPEAAAAFLSDALLQGQGLLARMLIAAPESLAGTRLIREPTAEDEAALNAYRARISQVLRSRWPLRDGALNELDPRYLPMSAGASAAWRHFADRVEQEIGPDGRLSSIRPFAAKAGEHAARLAGILTMIEDVDAIEITRATMENAVTLAGWYVSEALRLRGGARTDPELLGASQLLEWLQSRAEAEVSIRAILQFGPSSLRTKAAADKALGILLSHGWIYEHSGRPRRIGVVKDTGSR